MMAAPITSPGRFSPRGPLGIGFPGSINAKLAELTDQYGTLDVARVIALRMKVTAHIFDSGATSRAS
jgi:gamma-glutamyltranspeptidase